MCGYEALNCCSHSATLWMKILVEDGRAERIIKKYSHICEDCKNLWIRLYLKPDPVLDLLVTRANKSPFLFKPTGFRFYCLNQKHLNRYTES